MKKPLIFLSACFASVLGLSFYLCIDSSKYFYQERYTLQAGPFESMTPLAPENGITPLATKKPLTANRAVKWAGVSSGGYKILDGSKKTNVDYLMCHHPDRIFKRILFYLEAGSKGSFTNRMVKARMSDPYIFQYRTFL